MTVPLIALLAALLLAVTLQDAFEVMLLPRQVTRELRLVRLFYRATWWAWSGFARRFPHSPRREHFLGVYGALSMVLLFGLWMICLIIGFGLLLWALQVRAPVRPPPTLTGQLYLSGVTFFTLGYGDLAPLTRAARLLSVVEAGTGLGFIAVVIGYLPVLYQLFARREAHVIQLDSRAGSPPTAVALLQRHEGADGLMQLGMVLREWEVWGSELLESHLSYPMLAYYRSQHDDQSWLAALAAVIDCCALVLVGLEGVPTLQARMTFTMGRQILVEMARSLRVRPSPYTGGNRLDGDAFRLLEVRLAEAALPWTTAEAEDLLTALRATYEPLLAGLADYLLLPLQGFSAADDARDHWSRGHRGTLARRLIAELPERLATEAPPPGSSRWRRLRNRLAPDA